MENTILIARTDTNFSVDVDCVGKRERERKRGIKKREPKANWLIEADFLVPKFSIRTDGH